MDSKSKIQHEIIAGPDTPEEYRFFQPPAPVTRRSAISGLERTDISM